MADNDELLASIAGRARVIECESCGAKEWSIQEGSYALVAVNESEGLDLASGVPVNAVICRNCGFIRLYSTRMGS